jgi:hypothetical protein
MWFYSPGAILRVAITKAFNVRCTKLKPANHHTMCSGVANPQTVVLPQFLTQLLREFSPPKLLCCSDNNLSLISN